MKKLILVTLIGAIVVTVIDELLHISVFNSFGFWRGGTHNLTLLLWGTWYARTK